MEAYCKVPPSVSEIWFAYNLQLPNTVYLNMNVNKWIQTPSELYKQYTILNFVIISIVKYYILPQQL